MRASARTLAACLLLLLYASPRASAQNLERTAPERAATREYPRYDQRITIPVQAVLRADRLERMLKADRSNPELLRLLGEAGRLDEAMNVLSELATAPPERVVGTLRHLSTVLDSARRDFTSSPAGRIFEAIAPVAGRVRSMPREIAAEVVTHLANVESQANRTFEPSAAAMRLEYRDTLFTWTRGMAGIPHDSRGGREQLKAYDRYVDGYPGTSIAAAALFQKAWQLGHNSTFLVDYPVADRLIDVAAIVRELESGKYPRDRSVLEAPSLVTDFFVFEDREPLRAEHAPRVLEALWPFVRSHTTTIDNEDFVDSSVFYVITSKMARLLRPDDPAAGVEAVVRDLGQHGLTPAEVEFTLGCYHLQQSTAGPGPAQATMREKARVTFARLAENGRDYFARKAFATLASMAFFDADDSRARELYQGYIALYPESPWRWVAEWRIAQTFEEQGDLAAAIRGYDRLTQAFPTEPVAVVHAWNALGRVFEIRGDFGRALDAYTRARNAWHPAFTIQLWDEPTRGRYLTTASTTMWERVVLKDLDARLVKLRDVRTVAGADVLAKGRSEIERLLFPEAVATLRALLKSQPASPLSGEARQALHHAQLRHALNLANLHRTDYDEAASLAVLTELAKEPMDFYVAAGEFTRSILELRKGAREVAATISGRALDGLLEVQTQEIKTSAPTPLEQDVIAIRAELFRPAGDHPLIGGAGWEANRQRPADGAERFALVRATVDVKEVGQESKTLRLLQRYPAAGKVIALDPEHIETLQLMLLFLGGGEQRPRASIMEPFNSPAGPAVDIAAHWRPFFWVDPGHWGGWIVTTDPHIGSIEFLDAARSRAAVKFGVRYEGGTVIMQKVNGEWRAIEVRDRWIM